MQICDKSLAFNKTSDDLGCTELAIARRFLQKFININILFST
ncbi:hypothetical protein [Nostoc sp. PCC 7107]|nr:hypothetical protein [Nostoc sp. PCC 7107]